MPGPGGASLAAPVPGSWVLGWEADATQRPGWLVGGRPARVVRLTPGVERIVEQLRAGASVDEAGGDLPELADEIARRLVTDGFAWFVPPDRKVARVAEQVTTVVPAKDAADELRRLLAGGRVPIGVHCIVVDDGSSDDTAEVAAALGASVERHPRNRGPAAARNSGWRAADTPIVLFADADATIPVDWSAALAHFDDPGVGAVIPRVVPARRAGADTLAERYEQARFVYDLGNVPGDIAPELRLGYATSVLLFVRRDALADIGGFADDLRYGEDFDLVRRLTDAGWIIRYEPRCEGEHQARRELWPLLRLHHSYGTPVGELARRAGVSSMGGSTTVAGLAGVAVAVGGHPLVGITVLAGGVLVRLLTLRGCGPLRLTGSLALRTELRAARTAGAAASTIWLPAAALASARSKFGSLVLVSLLAGRFLMEWRRSRPRIDPLRWVLLRALDDAALTSGIWRSVVRSRVLAPLRPAIVRTHRSRPTDPPERRRIGGWDDVAVLRSARP